jgi:hypothetical protein
VTFPVDELSPGQAATTQKEHNITEKQTIDTHPEVHEDMNTPPVSNEDGHGEGETLSGEHESNQNPQRPQGQGGQSSGERRPRRNRGKKRRR